MLIPAAPPRTENTARPETVPLVRYAIRRLPPLNAILLWAAAAPALQEFSPFTSGIHLIVYLPSMLYL